MANKDGKKQDRKSALDTAIANFNLDDPDLPDPIDKAALASGNYPYERKMKRKPYEKELRKLQTELAKLQGWARETGERFAIIFEGRDSAGKGSTITRFTQHLNPRHARVIALTKPTETELGQWYFQRYIHHMPTSGAFAIFDRSWYNRAGVERVMGFCTEDQVAQFFREVPQFEQMLVRDGIHLHKYWLTIGRPMQLKRFHARRHDPLKQWKLSPIDIAALGKWDEYTAARDDMFRHSHTELTPWTVVRANDKMRTRLNVLRHFLSGVDYPNKNVDVVGEPDPKIVGSGDHFFFDT